MNQYEAISMAKDLLAENGYSHIPVNICRSKRMIAYVKFKGQYNEKYFNIVSYIPVGLYISSYFIPNLNEGEIKDTILHEIAHIIAGYKSGHKHLWQKACRSLGIDPARIKNVKEQRNIERTAKWIGICPVCNKNYYAYRSGKKIKNSIWRCSCGGEFKYQLKSSLEKI